MRIWERFFLKELALVMLLILTGFYLLYVLIDYSAHAKIFHQEALPFSRVILYYLQQFVQRAGILVPFALLIGTVKVLTTANTRREIVALVAGGIPLRRVVRPFLLAATLLAALLYVNEEWALPRAQQSLDAFQNTYFADDKDQGVGHLPLQDQSLIVYNHYDRAQQRLIDAFWLKNGEEIVRMGTLDINTGAADDVDHIKNGKVTHLEHSQLSGVEIDQKALFDAEKDPATLSFSHLWSEMNSFGLTRGSHLDAKRATHFFAKLFMPLICVLVVIGAAPFCLAFSRQQPTFFIYALAIFGLITYLTLVASSTILGTSQVIPPFWVMSVPPLLFFLVFGVKYAKL